MAALKKQQRSLGGVLSVITGMAIRKIKIVEYGNCQPKEGTTKDKSEESPTGYFLHADAIEFIEISKSIELRIGLNVGISYQFETDSNEGEIVDFECKISHPQLTNPETNERFVVTSEKKDGWSDELGFDFYSFEFDWELQQGNWTFEIILNDKVMCEQTFELKKKRDIIKPMNGI